MSVALRSLGLLGLAACGGSQVFEVPFETPPPSEEGTGTPPEEPPDPVTTPPVGDCGYPAAYEPMALGQVLPPYSWPEARHRDGVRTASLSLVDMFCDTGVDDRGIDIDWSPFDVLLFVSIPAW